MALTLGILVMPVYVVPDFTLVVAAIAWCGIMSQMYLGLFTTFIWLVAWGGTFLYGAVSIANIIHYRRVWTLKSVILHKFIPVVTIGVMGYLFIAGVPRYILIIGAGWGLVGLVVMWIIWARKGRRAVALEYEVVTEAVDVTCPN